MKVNLQRQRPKLVAVEPVRSIADRLVEFHRRLNGLRADTPRNKDAALELLNERHFSILMGKHYVVRDEMVDDDPILPQTDTEFKKRYQPYWYRVPSKKRKRQSLGTIWWNWPDRRSYPGRLVFKPTGAEPAHRQDVDFNLWRGFRVHPKRGDWSLFNAHLLNIVCRGHGNWRDYLLDYFAHLLQFPGRLPGVAPTIRGQQGTGKTIVYKMFELLLHPWNAVLLDDAQRLGNHFNFHLAGKLLVCADEALFARNHEMFAKLKSTITGERPLFEAKGVDPVSLDNYIRLIIISNEEHVLDAARDERRYFVLETADTYAKRPNESDAEAAARRRPYFDAISKQMMYDGGAEAMMYDLLKRDISGFDPRLYPDTPFLAQQKALSRRPHEKWLAAKLEDDSCAWWFDPNATRLPTKRDVYDDYKSVAWQYDRRSPLLSPEQIGQFLSRVFGLGVGMHKQRHDGKQRSVYTFPSLDEARLMFEQYSGISGRKLRVRAHATPRQ